VLPPRDSGCVTAPKLRYAEIRLPSEGLWLPALTMSASPEEIFVAAFTELPVGSRVTIALSDRDGTIVVDGVVVGEESRGLRIVFEEVSAEVRVRLADFGRRNTLLGDVDELEESSERVA
jgi:hypothetical protein